MQVPDMLIYATFISVIIAILYNIGKGAINFWHYKVKGAVDYKKVIESFQTLDVCKAKIDATQKTLDEIKKTVDHMQKHGSEGAIKGIAAINTRFDKFEEKWNPKLDKMGRKIARINERVYLIEAKGNGGLDKTPRFPEDDEEI